jgi:hypothetical protein
VFSQMKRDDESQCHGKSPFGCRCQLRIGSGVRVLAIGECRTSGPILCSRRRNRDGLLILEMEWEVDHVQDQAETYQRDLAFALTLS